MASVKDRDEVYMMKVRYPDSDDIVYRVSFSGDYRKIDYSDFISALEPGTFYVHTWDVEFDTPSGIVLYSVTDFIELHKKEDLMVFKLKYGYEFLS